MTCPYLRDGMCHAVLYFDGPRPLTRSEMENCMTNFQSCPDYRARHPLPPIDYAKLRMAERSVGRGGEPKAVFRRASEL